MSLRQNLTPKTWHVFALLAWTAFLCMPIGLAAAPVVNGVVPPLGHPGDVVKINGSGFNTTPSQNLVLFGPNQAAVLSATPTQLTVQVPNGQPLGPAKVSVNGASGPTFNTATNTKLANIPPNPAAGPYGCDCPDPNSSPSPSRSANLGGVLGGSDGGTLYGERGEFFQFLTDLGIPGRTGSLSAVQFSVQRQYRSASTSSGPLGSKWEHNYFESLTVEPDGSIVDHYLGRNDRYLVNNQGNFVAPPEFYTTLVRNSDGSYTLTYRDRTVKQFSSTGALLEISDRNGNSLSFSYNGSGQLATVTDTLGRTITYTYNAGGNLTQIQDFEGRTVTYSYDAYGDLTSATTPAVTGTPNGNDFPAGKTTRYTYDSNHNLLTITRPNETASSGPAALQNTYNAQGMIVSQFYGGTNATGSPAGGTYAFTYTPLNVGVTSDDPKFPVMTTQQTDRNGNVTQYDYNRLGYPLAVREYTRGLRPTDPAVYVTTMAYNADGRLTQKTMAAGNTIQYTYDAGNPDRYQQGNLLQQTQTPDATRGGDQSFITTTYTYEPNFNHMATMTEPRGNDPSYAPQNGGAQSAARYTTNYQYDSFGNLIQANQATVTLPSGATQQIITNYTYNSFGQIASETDPEGNVTLYEYCPTATPSCSAPSSSGGGYLQEKIIDAATSPRRTETTPPAMITMQYFYDPVGNVVRQIDGRGNDKLFTYNQLNQVVETQSESPFRYTIYTFYDANDNIIERNTENQVAIVSNGAPVFTSGGSFTTQDGTPAFFQDFYTYDILDSPVKDDLDATGSTPARVVSLYQYDANQNQIQETLPAGNIVRNQFDERNLLLTQTRGFGASGASTVTQNYDQNRNLVEVVDGRGFDTNYQYDGFDRRNGITDAVGSRAASHYDPDGNSVAMSLFGQPGGPSPTNSSGSGNVTLSQRTWEFDELSRRYQYDELPINGSSFVAAGVSTARPPSVTPGPLAPPNISLQVIYDRNSRIVEQIQDDLATTAVQYDGVNRQVLRTDPQGNTIALTYDANSNLTATVETDLSQVSGVPAETFTTTYQYDNHNRQTSVSDNCQNTRRTAYDSRNNLTNWTDAKGDAALGCPGTQNGQGNSTRYAYDGLGRRVQATEDLRAGGIGSGAIDTSNPFNPGGQITTSSTYDGNGRLTSITDNNGNTTLYSYDALDRRTAETLADGTATAMAYDLDDNIVTLTDNNGTVQTHTYDAVNRRIQIVVSPAAGVIGTTVNTYQYDGRSRMTQMTDNNAASDPSSASTVNFVYDSLDRPVEESQNAHAFDAAWFAQAQRTSLTYPDSRQLIQTYDSLERILTIQDQGASSSLAQFSYIGDDRILQRQYQNGTQLTYLDNSGTTDVGYDPLRRTIQRRDLNTGGSCGAPPCLIVGFQHIYDRENNKADEAKLRSSANSEAYSYDSVDRITAFARGTLSGTNPPVVSSPSTTQEWALDGVGNWGEDTLNGVPETFTVNSVNEYTSVTAGQFLYDANGNMTYNGVLGTAYQYDYKNRLRQVCSVAAMGNNCSSGGATLLAVYSYDAMNRRTRKVVTNSSSNGVTNFYYDGWRTVEERDGADTVTQQYVYGTYLDEPIVLDQASGQRFFYHQNTLSSTFALTDTSGNVVEGYQYDAYGNPTVLAPDFTTVTGASSAFGNPYLFNGQRLDSETGLYYFKNRYYSPQFGRFLSRDPFGYGDSMNLFEYVASGPTANQDPLGLAITIGGNPVDKASPQYQAWLKNEVFKEILNKMGNVQRPINFASMDDLALELLTRSEFAKCMCSVAKGEVAAHFRGPGERPGTAARGNWGKWIAWDYRGKDPSGALTGLMESKTTAFGCIEAGYACAWVALRNAMEQQKPGSFNTTFGGTTISVDTQFRNPLVYKEGKFSLESYIGEQIPGDLIRFMNYQKDKTLMGQSVWKLETAVYIGGGKYCGAGIGEELTAEEMRKQLLREYNAEGFAQNPKFKEVKWEDLKNPEKEMPIEGLRRINRNFR
jgi:RHS repeat-associated protein